MSLECAKTYEMVVGGEKVIAAVLIVMHFFYLSTTYLNCLINTINSVVE
jgi:hypothetical protein